MNLPLLSKLLLRLAVANFLLILGLCFVLSSCEEDEPEELSDFTVQVDSVTTHRAFIGWSPLTSTSGKEVRYNVELDNGFPGAEVYKYSDAVHLFKLQPDSAYSGVIVAYTDSYAKRAPFTFHTLTDTTTYSLSLSLSQLNQTSAILDWKLRCNEDESKIEYSLYINDFLSAQFTDEGQGSERKGQRTFYFTNPNTIYVGRITAKTSKGIISSNEISFTTPADPVFSGDLTITTQEEIDNFSYTRVTGTLTIIGQGITNLAGLSKLRYVYKKLEVSNTSITSMTGTELLTINLGDHDSGGPQLTIADNAFLEEIPRFQSIAWLEDLIIHRNPKLKNLDGFVYLDEISSNLPAISQSVLELIDNPSLENIDGLRNLTRIIRTNVAIDNNDLLQNLNGLENTSAMSFGQSILRITNNDSLSDFCGLKKMVTGNTFNDDVQGNPFNPTPQEIIDGPCSQ